MNESNFDDSSGSENSASDNLNKAIDEWIVKNGVGFELQIASLIKQTGNNDQVPIALYHSRQYTDFDDKLNLEVLREIDVVARLSKRISNEFWIHTWLIVECKNIHNPFVLYKDTKSTTLPIFQPIDDIWPILKKGEIEFNNIAGSTNSDFLNVHDNVWCYALNSKSDNNSKNFARDAYLQVNSAVAGIQKQSVLSPNTSKELHIYVPILATTAPIFNLWLDHDGGIAKQETTRELLVTQPSLSAGKQLGTWVVNFEGMKSLVQDWIEFHKNLDYRFH